MVFLREKWYNEKEYRKWRLGEDTTVTDRKTDNFNGLPSEYLKLGEFYDNDNNIKSPDHSKLNEYNGVITRNVIIYAGSVLVLTIFVFFRKPLAQMFESRRVMKANKAKAQTNPKDDENK